MNAVLRRAGAVPAIAVLLAAAAASSCGARGSEGPLLGFCGAAGKPALEACAAEFARKSGIGVDLQFGGSGQMLSAIEMSGRGDVYVAGSPDYMEDAILRGLVDGGTVVKAAYLVPCILVQKGNPRGVKSLEDLAAPGIRVCIGNPDAVCLGAYAMEIFEKAGIGDAVGKNVAVHAESCSKVASLVAMKKVDAAIGWDACVGWNPGAVEAVPIGPESVPRIACIPAAACTAAKRPAEARAFVEFLASPEGKLIFTRAGYLTDEGAARRLAPHAEVGGRCVFRGRGSGKGG